MFALAWRAYDGGAAYRRTRDPFVYLGIDEGKELCRKVHES